MKKLFYFGLITGCLSSPVSGQVAIDGELAAQVTNASPGAFLPDTGFDQGSNMVAVTGGTNVTVTFWARSANATPSRFFRAAVAFFEGQDPNGNGTVHLGDHAITPPMSIVPLEWKRYTANITVPPTATVFSIGFRVDGGGMPPHSIVIDNVSVVDNSTVPPTVLPVSNPSFEVWPDPASNPPTDWRHFAVAQADGFGSIEREENPPAATDATETLLPIFKRDAGTVVNDWFTTDANTRGMAFNPLTNHLLVVDRSDNLTGTIRVLDATTGLEVAQLNTTGIDSTNATFIMNKIGVDDSGRIFVANLAANNRTFRLYMYDNEIAAIAAGPTLVYSLDVNAGNGGRFGDDMDVTGSGANTRIVVSARANTDRVLAITDPENDGVFTGIDYSVPGINGPSNVAFLPDPNQFAWHRSLGFFNENQTPDYPNISLPVVSANFVDGTSTGADPYRLNTPHPTGPFDISPHPTRGTLMVVGPAEAEYTTETVNIAGYGYNFDNNQDVPFKTGGLEAAGGFVPNGNGTGDVIIDPIGNRIFFLVTANSISSWNLPLVSRVDEWMLF